MSKIIFIALAALLSLGTITACSDDTQNDNNAPNIDCEDDELYNPRDKTCVKMTPDLTDADITDITEETDTDLTGEETDTDLTGEETDTPDPIDPECDKDGDGYLSYACGGLDCDDDNPNVNPGQIETCSGIDDNCNGMIDEFLECTFFAHTADALYRINPFEGTLDKESDLIDSADNEITLNDIDTHPSGTLYGIGFPKNGPGSALYIFDTTENIWIKAATLKAANLDFPRYANGLAIDFDGTGFITVDNQLFKIDLTNTERLLNEKGLKDSSFSKITTNLTPLQVTPDYFISSGDSVVNKQNTLFMTSKHDDQQDHLVEINRDTAAATNIGPIGFTRVYGLTAAWNKLYGTTRDGQLITINTKTGEGKLINNFPDKKWYGAASSPNR